MKYKIVFKEGDLTVFDTIDIDFDQLEMLKKDPSVLSLEQVFDESIQ